MREKRSKMMSKSLYRGVDHVAVVLNASEPEANKGGEGGEEDEEKKALNKLC